MLPPFMNSTGLVTKILDKIIEAKQPDRFTQDFLETKLGYSGGSARPIIGLLKRIGFLGSDGTPTPLYARFRNKEERGRAMADALAIGYKDVYARNEYAHDMPKDKFKSLIIEMTGEDASSTSVIAIVSTFFALKTYADFDAKPREDDKKLSEIVVPSTQQPSGDTQEGRRQHPTSTGLNLSYTINLNLPETTDVNVFNAIFSSLKEHLLKS